MRLRFWKKDPPALKSKQKQAEDVAKAVQMIIDSGYSSEGRIYRINFIRGIFVGLGSAIGATLVLGFVLWVLSLFSEIPIFGGIVETIQNTIDASQ
ncbi:MAG: DUF5665 domain-containing protein [Patescibacteria group bacterium]